MSSTPIGERDYGFPRIEYGAGLSEPAPDLIRGPE